MNKLARKFRRLFWRLTASESEKRHQLVGRPDSWEMKREFQYKFLTENGLEPQHYLVDLGCGTLRGGIPLIELLDAGHYYGLEARAEVLEQGREELKKYGLEDKSPTLLVSDDLANLEVDQKFDVIWSFAVLIHMSDDILETALTFVSKHLKSDGIFYANVNISDEPDGHWQGFPIVRRSFEFYEDACRRHGMSVKDIGPLTDFGHSKPGQSVEKQAYKRMLEIRQIAD